jgi:hypothetical protein
MQAGDYGEERSEPWTYRKRVVPLKTWSGRVVHNRRRHFFTITDVSRILAKIQPPDDTPNMSAWINGVISALREATLGMLDKLLFFMDSGSIEYLYQFAIDLLDKMFRIDQGEDEKKWAARRLIIQIADRVGLNIEFKK